jgi:hypothetical protein
LIKIAGVVLRHTSCTETRRARKYPTGGVGWSAKPLDQVRRFRQAPCHIMRACVGLKDNHTLLHTRLAHVGERTTSATLSTNVHVRKYTCQWQPELCSAARIGWAQALRSGVDVPDWRDDMSAELLATLFCCVHLLNKVFVHLFIA